MIWRREEVLKVFIHELIHYLDLDVKNDINLTKIFNYNIGKIEQPILINETMLNGIIESHANDNINHNCYNITVALTK